MKALLINLTIYSAMTALIVADEFYSIEYAGNLAIFLAWVFIVAGFACLPCESKTLFKDRPALPALSKTCQYLMIFFMVAVGWTATGLFYFIAAFFMSVKHSIYKDELKKQAV